jgi:transcriptional regulator with XRE-family HTH domain
MKLGIIFFDALFRDTCFVSKLQNQLGARIRELRNLSGMSREEYSAKIRLSARRVASLELGDGWPRPASLERIAKSFGIEVRDLFDFSSARILPRKPL